ncbi:MAG: Rrf2 family transcriptional regulator [Christensenella sp.]|uniref:RrF2 family transcriptional regulator n=1 Tax=Christensenella sp. TaxID=1935934 RepID=UPI002B1F6F06|nr:Rrf2 family transcriptional regulator [Christensenella sp.]MEA5002839.1 Rrf2 family transcriptional regulator [Christensenella sp.]
MKISAKGRYGLSAMIYLAFHAGTSKSATLLKISENLDISKIYLEQVFSLLKKAGLVSSIKGSGGGYQLSREASLITAYDILDAIEVTLFEKTEPALPDKGAHINEALDSLLWDRLDTAMRDTLRSVHLSELVDSALASKQGGDYMYFI